MNALTVALILLLPLVALWWESARLTPLVVTSLYLTPILLGYSEFDQSSGSRTALMYCAGLGCFILGHIAHQGWCQLRVPSFFRPSGARLSARSSPPIVLFVLVVVGLAFYHFSAAGVPLVSDNVEVTRFDFTSSGLFGVPGRMFLYGLPFAVLLVSSAACRPRERVSRALLWFVWLSYALASLLGGFKGGLVAVIITMLLVRSVAGRPLSVRGVVAGWRVLVVIAAVSYCAVLSFWYRSLGLTNPSDVIPYLAARATVNAAAPGYLVFLRYGTSGTGGELFGRDADYFLKKYFPFIPFRDDTALPLDKTISAELNHIPVSSNLFIVPVTVGAFPELVANVGLTFALGGMMFVGWFFSYLMGRARGCRTAFRSAVLALAVHFLQMYMVYGNLMYIVFNFALMAAMLSALYGTCRMARYLWREVPALAGPAVGRRGVSVLESS